MNCNSTRRQSTAYVDGRLRNREQSRITAHLRECDACASYMDEIRSLRSGLQRLPVPQAAASLATKLRIIASREKQALMLTRGSRLLLFWQTWKFRAEGLTRPFTIPATGGLLSSILLFASLALTITTSTRRVAYDVPVLYEEQMTANLLPITLNSDVVLNISLDSKGHIQDYAFHGGSTSLTGDPGRLINNNISMPQFPSVFFAHPITSDISIKLKPLIFRQ